MVRVGEVNSEGKAALASLINLRKLSLDSSITDDGRIGQLANCQQLTEISLSNSILSQATFIALIRFCPGLKMLSIGGVSGISTPDMSIAVLDSFWNIGNRKIEVEICGVQKIIWKLAAVKTALDHLKQNDGPDIHLH